MDKVTLTAQKRTIVGKKVKKLRKDGMLPANIYGKKMKSQSIQVGEKDFSAIFTKSGETGLIELLVDKVSHPVLIHNVSYHPVTSVPLHVDFFQVDLKEKVTTKVPLAFIGEAPAVKDKLGVLLNILSEVEIEALPTDLPEKLEVDISKMAAVGDTLKVSDLKFSDKIKVLADVNQEVIKVAPLVSKEAEKMAKEDAEAKAAAVAEVATTAEGKPQEGEVAKAPPAGTTAAPPSKAPSEAKKA